MTALGRLDRGKCPYQCKTHQEQKAPLRRSPHVLFQFPLMPISENAQLHPEQPLFLSWLPHEMVTSRLQSGQILGLSTWPTNLQSNRFGRLLAEAEDDAFVM